MDITIKFMDGNVLEFKNKYEMDVKMGLVHSVSVDGQFVVVTTPHGRRRWFHQSTILEIDESPSPFKTG